MEGPGIVGGGEGRGGKRKGEERGKKKSIDQNVSYKKIQELRELIRQEKSEGLMPSLRDPWCWLNSFYGHLRVEEMIEKDSNED